MSSTASSSPSSLSTSSTTKQNHIDKNENDKKSFEGESYLFAFDFDHTVVSDNSDTVIIKLANSPIPPEVKSFYDGSNWTDYMNKIFEWLSQQGVTITEISKCVQKMETTPGMVHLLKSLVQMKTSPTNGDAYKSITAKIGAAKEDLNSSPPPAVNLLVISDANDMFIGDFLKTRILSENSPNLNNTSLPPGTFQFPFDMITNRASVFSTLTPGTSSEIGNNNENDRTASTSDKPLKIGPFENQTSCKICPRNLCKGNAILKYIQDKGPFTRVFYSGDGSNDVCPALKLNQHDLVFVRKNYRMHKLLQKSSNNLGITANLVYWEEADTIQSTISQNLFSE